MTMRFALPVAFAAVGLMAGAERGDPAKGKQLFASCAGCHNVDSDARKMGPSLRSLFGRVTLRNGKRADDENVREIVLDGFNGMPSFRYSFRPAEIDDLLAYLHTLKTPPATSTQATAGENVFRAFCVRCHNSDARTATAPDVRGTLTTEQWKKVDEGHGGAPPMSDWLDPASRETVTVYLRNR